MAAEKVLVEAEELLEIGKLRPEDAMTPGVLVDHVIKGAAK
jgi:acetate CoA/acetoacetate CoA-transferase alpha subunit